MTNHIIRNIALSGINFEDKTYKTGFRSADAELTQSIGRLGVLFDPIVLETDNGYSIISGFNRLSVLKSAGVTETRAIVWKGFDCGEYEKEILKKIYSRTIGPIGRIHAFRIISTAAGDDPEELKSLRERLGIPKESALKAERISKYAALISFVDRKDSNYRVLNTFSDCDDVFLDFMNKCLSNRDFRFSIFREIAEICSDIVRNEEMRSAAIEMMSVTDVSLSDELILGMFRSIRFPISESHRMRVSETVSFLKSRGVTLSIPGNSEDGEAMISFLCRRKDGGKGFRSAVDFLGGIDPGTIIRHL